MGRGWTACKLLIEQPLCWALLSSPFCCTFPDSSMHFLVWGWPAPVNHWDEGCYSSSHKIQQDSKWKLPADSKHFLCPDRYLPSAQKGANPATGGWDRAWNLHPWKYVKPSMILSIQPQLTLLQTRTVWFPELPFNPTNLIKWCLGF